MKLARILIDFSNLTDSKLSDFASKVLIAMGISIYFPTPSPTLAVLKAAIDAFVSAIGAAEIGGPTQREFRELQKAALVTVLFQLANDSMNTAQGDRLKLISTGYNVSPENSTRGILGLILKFLVKLGAVSGSVILRSNGVKNAKTYTFQYSLGPVTANTVWVSISFSKATFMFTGLEAGKEYSFRMIAIGTNGQESFSEVITRMVV